MRQSAIAAAAVVLILQLATHAGEGTAQLTLTLRSERGAYLLGEPVLLEASLRNCGTEPISEIRADRPHPYQDVEILTSHDGRTFTAYKMGIYPSWKIVRKREVLEPGKSWKFSLRILYTFERASGLAVERTGRFFVKLRYPLISRSAETRTVVESDSVTVRIARPAGKDAEVWKLVDEPQYAYFLQSGLDRTNDRHVPLTIINVLRTVPKSGYHPALRWALRKYYEGRLQGMSRRQIEDDGVLRQIREVLGIELKPEGPFPDDRRLDVLVTYHFPALTPLEDAFKEISKQSPVPIRLAPELHIRRMKSVKQTKTLRAFMDSQDDHNAKWIREKDGYRLILGAGP